MDERKLLDAARKHKNMGNEFYKAGNQSKAIKQYHFALMNIRAITSHKTVANMFVFCDAETIQAERPELLALRADCYNNLAACLLQKEDTDYEKVVYYCTAVLDVNPNNAKALFRTGQALYHLKKYDGALEAFQKIEREPGVKKYLQLCRAKLASQEQAMRETCLRMFASNSMLDTGEAAGGQSS